MHETGIRSDLNTWLPEKLHCTNFALSYISEAERKEEKEVFSRSSV